MDFPYDPNHPTDLAQGDLLLLTDNLKAVLDTYHPHYTRNPENRMFLVLTQSCDLVRRPEGIGCRYISLAPVRLAQTVVARHLDELLEPELKRVNRVGEEKAKNKFEMFLSRLINNNEQSYFFLRADVDRGLAEDHCAVLRLAVSIRAAEHYETCLSSRVASIQEAFRAKLGWLVGELYSRIGTEDWPADKLKERVRKYSDGTALWFDARRLKQLKKAVKEWETSNQGEQIDETAWKKIVGSLKDRKSETLLRISEILTKAPELKELDDTKRQSLLRRFDNDQTFTALIK